MHIFWAYDKLHKMLILRPFRQGVQNSKKNILKIPNQKNDVTILFIVIYRFVNRVKKHQILLNKSMMIGLAKINVISNLLTCCFSPKDLHMAPLVQTQCNSEQKSVLSLLKMDRSTYEILQIVGISLLEKKTINELFTNTNCKNEQEMFSNQLTIKQI